MRSVEGELRMDKSEIVALVLGMEHKIIKSLSIWEVLDNDRLRLPLIFYINGVNEMAQALLERMDED